MRSVFRPDRFAVDGPAGVPNERYMLALDAAVRASRQDDWRGNVLEVKRVKLAIKAELHSGDALRRHRRGRHDGHGPVSAVPLS